MGDIISRRRAKKSDDVILPESCAPIAEPCATTGPDCEAHLIETQRDEKLCVMKLSVTAADSEAGVSVLESVSQTYCFRNRLSLRFSVWDSLPETVCLRNRLS